MQITKPRTQRKKLFQAPAHLRHRYFSAPLAPDLKKKHDTNAVPLKTGDTVRVMRGDRKGFEGKVTRVNRKKYRIFVEGVTREKVDGSTMPIPIHPSKVMITNLDLGDKWRREALKRKGVIIEKETSPTEEAVVEEKKEEVKADLETKKPRRKKKKKAAPTKTTKTIPEEKKTRKTVKSRRKKTKKANETKAKKGAE